MTEMHAHEPAVLAVIWTTRDREAALNMAFMYTHNSKLKGWWEKVRLVVWGPSAKLLSEDAELQDHIRALKKDGGEVQACKACADSYGVSDPLSALGIEVIYMGEPLTKMLKEGWSCLTV